MIAVTIFWITKKNQMYDAQHLLELFDYFHRNLELSSMELKTAA